MDSCCTPCPTTTTTVSIPGIQGEPGAAGTNGTNGLNAFSTLLADMIVPGDTVTPVTITVSSSLWMVIGAELIIGQGQGIVLTNPGPAHFIIDSIPSASSVTLLWLNESGDVPAGSQIDAQALVSPSGQQGNSGAVTTTKGDMIVDDGALSPSPSPQRFPVGANGRGIVADSSQVLGVKYAGLSQTMNVNTTPVVGANSALENNLQTYSLPANTLITNNDSIEGEMVFTTANTASDKTIRVYFGSTVLLSFTFIAGDGQNVRLVVCFRVVRTGAATQVAYAWSVGTGTTPALSKMQAATTSPVENTAGVIVIKGTAQLAIAAASEITQTNLQVNYRAA